MKKSILFSLAAVALFAASCQKAFNEKDINGTAEESLGNDVIVATMESRTETSGVKTEFGTYPSTDVLWSQGDSFALVSSDGKLSKFTLTAGAGTTEGTFSGSVQGTAPYYAVYPYSDGVTFAGGKIKFSLPKVQKGSPDNIAKGAVPCVAKLETAASDAKFKNVGGLLLFQFTGSGATINSIAVHDLKGNPLWGDYEVAFSDGVPQTTVTGGDNTAVLELDSPLALSSTASRFYVAVPAGSMGHGFSVVVYEEKDVPDWYHGEDTKVVSAYTFLQSTSNSKEIKRSSIRSLASTALVKNAESAYVSARGHYKDIFMDGGIFLTSRTTLPAQTSLGLTMEYFASNSHGSTSEDPGKLNAKDTLYQTQLITGSDNDENGILLYPDGSPRFRCVYMNGGKSTNHGISLGETGRQHYVDFVSHGGCYVGTCAGAFLTCKARGSSSDKTPKDPTEGFLHIWPGYTAYLTRKYVDINGNEKTETAITGAVHRARIVPNAGILKYYDFGGDNMISSIRHNGGCRLLEEGVYSRPAGTELLLQYYFPPEDQGKSADAGDTSKMNGTVCTWAYKDNAKTGRIIACGSHPEGYDSGETLDLMKSFLLYSMDGAGEIDVKGTLAPGEPRVMDRRSSDNNPEYARIGDCQYHHFKLEVPDSDNGVKLSVACDQKGVDLYLALRKGDFAWMSDADYVLCSKGGSKTICTRKLEPGTYYASVKCATTVTSTRTKYDPSGYYYKYTGTTSVLNGVPYTITYSLINPDGNDGAESYDTQKFDQTQASWD